MSEIQWFREAADVSRLALRPRPRSAGALMAAARRATGLRDFGDEPISDPLSRLLEAYRSDGRLNPLGRLATHWDLMRLLANRLILRDRERSNPAILARPVERPIFIMGLPRSGTAFLHRLLAMDPEARVAPCWRVIHPCPDHRAAGGGARPERVQSDFNLFGLMAPSLKRIQPFDAFSPQECGDITAHAFRSARFDATWDTPAYARWLKLAGVGEAYRLHRRFLQHLQGDAPGQWVLKWPDHVFALESLRAVYPDARIVFSHRNPARVLPSVARLTEVMRRPFARMIDRFALGRRVLADWSDGARRMVAAIGGPAATPIVHIHFDELTADPGASVARLYSAFDREFTALHRARIAEFVERRPNGGYGRNPCRAEDYGLRAGEIDEHFADYRQTFDLTAAGVRPRPSRSVAVPGPTVWAAAA